jgi:hypothetical protein
MLKNKWVDKIIIGIMICSVIVSVQYYFNMTNDSCMADPLVYGAKEIEKMYGYKFRGSGSLIIGEGSISSRLYFDSVNSSWSESPPTVPEELKQPLNITNIKFNIEK